MGGQHEWDELLSAYADDEATPAERSAAEALLASSPEARRVLNEMRTVSQLLHALPSPPAPPALLTTVQSKITTSVSPAPATPKRRFRGYRREWLAGFSAIAMTVLIGGLISLQWRNDVASESRMAELTVMTAAPAREWSDAPASELRMVELGTTSEVLQRTNTLAASAETKSVDRMLGTGSAATPAAPVADSMNRPLAETEMLDGLRLSSVDDVERLREVLPYLRLQDENGQAIGNVELVVVDAQRVANQFQVLLMQNGVTTLDARTVDFTADAAAAETARAPASAGKPVTDRDDLFAVYTEAPGEPLSKTLAELIKQREVLGMRFQPPLQLLADKEAVPEDKPVEKTRLNLKQLSDAYVTQRFDDASVSWNEDVVSAADAIAEARGEPADNVRWYVDQERRQLYRGRATAPRLAKANDATPKESPPATGRVMRGGAEINSNVASFNTLVKLPVPVATEEAVPLSGLELKDSQQLVRGNSQTVAAPAARPEDLAQMRSRFSRTAPDTYRILWVLQPVSPPTSTTPLPASRGSPER
jgi:hypothetical protein